MSCKVFLYLVAPVNVIILFKLLMKICWLKDLTEVKDSECLLGENMWKVPGVSTLFLMFIVILYRCYCDTNIWEIIWKSPLFLSGLFCSCFVKWFHQFWLCWRLPKTAHATYVKGLQTLSLNVYEKVGKKFQLFLTVILILYECYCNTNICQIICQASLFSSGLFCSCFVTRWFC